MTPVKKTLQTKSLFKVNYEQQLNPQQLEVVMAGRGPMLVIAGPGSGKTRTVTYRVARLIESGVHPESILLVTFTNKAARSMLTRVAGIVPIQAYRLWGGTFHHIGNKLLRKHAKSIGYQNNFTILDREDSKSLVDDIRKTIKLDVPKKNFPKSGVLINLFNYAVSTDQPLAKTIQQKSKQIQKFTPDIVRIFNNYTEKKFKQNLMDFDDLLLNWKKLFEEHPRLRETYAKQFEYILVDEYQDTNHLQGEIIDLMADQHRNLMVVGDDAQSIYSFRGADFTNIIEFPNRYPNVKVFKLETNYRSHPEILRLANSCIKNNTKQFPKNLKAVKPTGAHPRLVIVDNGFAQARFICREALKLSQQENIPLNEIAVLYRAHSQSMELQMELTKLRIPFEIRSGLRFFEQAHLKDVLSYLKLISNIKNELSWHRVLRLYPGIGPTTSEKLWAKFKDAKKFTETIKKSNRPIKLTTESQHSWQEFIKLIKKLDVMEIKNKPALLIKVILNEWYEDHLESTYPNARERSDDLKQLSAFADQFSSLDEFLSQVTLLTNVEGEEHRRRHQRDNLVLTTIHQAKGLEWRVVFMIGLVEGRFPDARSLAEQNSEEEERRLFYVGVTRTKEKLYLSYPLVSDKRGGLYEIIQQPSRFLEELDMSSYEEVRITSDNYQ